MDANTNEWAGSIIHRYSDELIDWFDMNSAANGEGRKERMDI